MCVCVLYTLLCLKMFFLKSVDKIVRYCNNISYIYGKKLFLPRHGKLQKKCGSYTNISCFNVGLLLGKMSLE